MGLEIMGFDGAKLVCIVEKLDLPRMIDSTLHNMLVYHNFVF